MGVESTLQKQLAVMQGHVAGVDGIPAAAISASAEVAYNGATFDVIRRATIFKPLNAVAIGAETTLWTPVAGKKFRLMGGLISVGTAAGNVILRDNTAGTTILIIPKHTLDVIIPWPDIDNGILSAAANNLLTGQGVATQTISGFLFGTEE